MVSRRLWPTRSILTLVALLVCSLAAAQNRREIRLPITRDNSIVLHPGEYDLNAGAKPRIRIKGNQHLVALAFDASRLRGKLIESAVLVMKQDRETLDAVTISTLSADWDERASTARSSGRVVEPGWGRSGAWFPALTDGNGHSLTCLARSEIRDGWYRWSVDPDLVIANALELAHGLVVHEASCDYSRNPTVFAREHVANAPYLLVRLGRGRPRKPVPPRDLSLSDDGTPEGLVLSLRAPDVGFAYDIRAGSRELPRARIPYVEPGEVQRIPLRPLDLRPGSTIALEVTTIGRTGARSMTTHVSGRVPGIPRTSNPRVPPLRRGKRRHEGLDVIPVLDRYGVDGNPIGGLPDGYRRLNAVFDGETIRLRAARGEVVGFQALIRGTGRAEADCRIPGLRVDLHRAVGVETPVGRVPDPLVPLDPLNLRENADTVVVADVFVPFETARKEYRGALTLTDGRSVPILLEVRGFTLPRRASFLCEMNTYGLPDRVERFYRLQEIAYDHRVHVNVLHYGHRSAAAGARKCVMDMRMASGRRMDERRYNDITPGARTTYWDDFVEVFGPFLSGRCFAKGHRGTIPAPGFYLTFHESWPLNVRSFFDGKPDAYEAFQDHPEYRRTWIALLKDFIRVAKREGWTGTGFQIYLNNKGSLEDAAKAPWILDEPTAYWDYRALAFYADLVREAKGPRCPIDVRYRIDISRPQFDRGQLEGKADFWVIGSRAFERYSDILEERRLRTGEAMWTYGTSSAVEASSRQIQAWVLDAYLRGASGVVPWQTVNRDGKALRRGDPLGLFVYDGSEAVRHSMRLKAYRCAQQDIEYLEILRRTRGWTRLQIAEFVSRHVPLVGETRKRSDADAGTRSYGSLLPEGFRTLREAVAMLIEDAD